MNDGKDLKVSNSDPIAGEVSIKAAIDQNSISIGGRSRLLAAADQLLGGLVGIPGAIMDGWRTTFQARAEQRETFIRLETAAAVKALSESDHFAQATAARLIQDEVRKQSNRAGVWFETEEALKLPPPSAAGRSTADQDDIALDPDWMNVFADHAGRASSDRLRGLWGRILAGEIRRPGSFSPATMAAVAELDADVARAFQDTVLECHGDICPSSEGVEGEAFDRFALLHERGLVGVFDGSEFRRFPSNSDGGCAIMGDTHALLLEGTPGVVYHLKVIRLTRVGRELASILPRDEEAVLRANWQKVTPSAAKVRIVRLKSKVLEKDGWSITWDDVETLVPGDATVV